MKIKITKTVEGFYEEGQILDHDQDRYARDGKHIGCSCLPHGKALGEAGFVVVSKDHYKVYRDTGDLINERAKLLTVLKEGEFDEFEGAMYGMRRDSIEEELINRGINLN